MIEWMLTTPEGWALPRWGAVCVLLSCLAAYPAWARRDG